MEKEIRLNCQEVLSNFNKNVKKSIEVAIQNDIPIARYDIDKKCAFLEYPNGEKVE